METQHTQSHNFDINVFVEATSKLSLDKSYDDVFFQETNQGFITGVIDAAVNVQLDDYEKINRQAIKDFVSLAETLPLKRAASQWAHIHHNRLAFYKHRNPLLAVSAVEINLNKNTLEFYRAADCEVWVLTNNEWVNLFPEHMWTTKGLKVAKIGQKKNPTLEQWWSYQEKELDDLDLWRYPTLGLSPHPVFGIKRMALDNVQEIVLSTDGALLNEEKLRTLDPWLGQEIHKEREGRECNHGDIALTKIVMP